MKEYLEHHLDEFGESEQNELGLKPSNNINQKIEELYKRLHLKRIGLYPISAFGAEFAIFDFTISDELTNYLVVMKMNKEGEISELTTES